MGLPLVQPVDAPAIAAPRVSLVGSAPPNPADVAAGRGPGDGGALPAEIEAARAENVEHWINGIGFRRRLCGDASPSWDCFGDLGSEPPEKTITADSDGLVTWRPHWVWTGDKCTALQWQQDGPARARESLEARDSKAIASELWTGTTSQTADLGNTWLADPLNVDDLTPIAGQSSPLVYALAALGEVLQDQPGRGMIHATPTTVQLWAAARAIRREGPVWLDAMDNIVVADDGYDGSEPDGSIDSTGQTAYAYATGIVHVWRGPTMIVPGEFEDIAEALDRSVNLVEWRAEKPVLAFWDRCIHAGIRVNLCETCCASEDAS